MEWLTSIRKAIVYMEDHLQDDISVQDVSKEVCMSPMFLQKGFSIMTGFGVIEYLRNRRLYEAAKDIQHTDEKIIDIAFRYAYETPESFTKAFTRFHGATPSQIRLKEAPVRKFLPLRINVIIHGGYEMEFKIESMTGFKVIGFEKTFDFETCKAKIPVFWDEIFSTVAKNISMGKAPATPEEKALVENQIGTFGICIDDEKTQTLRYIIAGEYKGGEVPKGMTLYEFPDCEWAKFDCIGAIPKAIQDLNDKIFKEWLPGNPEYEITGNASIEWYSPDSHDQSSHDYHSAVWIPVKKK